MNNNFQKSMVRKKTILTGASIFLLHGLLFVSAASADASVCLEDVKKHCQGIQPGEGRIEACLLEKKTKVSAACLRTIKEHHDNFQSFVGNCRDDAREYCRDVGYGLEKLQDCLNKNKRKLSRECKSSLSKLK